TGLILLKRRDRIRQAISFSRGKMTGKFRSTHKSVGDEDYNFELICQLFWYIDRSYCFWESYLSFYNYRYKEFYYEDLLPSPDEYVECVSNFLSVPKPDTVYSGLEIQRDEKTEEWVNRFKSDMAHHDFLGALRDKPASRTLRNFVRFASKEPMTGWTQLLSQY
ncbi:MAG: Stf0 family sulfotransferase, partial [Rhizobiaceae bacterium]